MWQRIQTLYLIIAIFINALIFSLSFIVTVTEATVDSIMNKAFSAFGTMGEPVTTLFYPSSIIALVCGASMLLSLIIIMLFNKRQLQIKLSQLNLLMQLAVVVGIFLTIDSAAAISFEISETYEIEYSTGTYLSIIPLLFIYLAIRAIKKDEALVRAADRIR